MKIGILTLPLVDNYGGILQAFALQTSLKKMGHEVYLINRRRNSISMIDSMKMRLKSFVLYLQNKDNDWVFSEKMWEEKEILASCYTKQFIDKYIYPQTNSLSSVKDLKKMPRLDAYIVGSDQVWRPQYTPNIYNYFFDFLEGVESKRIAYAASFGTEDWPFTITQTKKCKRLLRLFTSISVREDIAVDMCRQYFEVDALHVLDPTLLLSAEEYLSLIDLSLTQDHKEEVMSYILDQDTTKKQIVNTLAKALNYKVFDLTLTGFNKDSKLESTPPVETWLKGFVNAKYIITDSFHGTIFSILFNKPFIAIGNSRRGLSRFKSLLSIFSLEDRLIIDFENVESKIKNSQPIDWNRINKIIEENRSLSLDFLIKSLNT